MLKNKITLKQIQSQFRLEKNPQLALALARFFKTGPGQYGEGDQFLGIKVPTTRKYAKKFLSANLATTKQLVRSRFHEERLLALIILVMQYQKAVKENDPAKRELIYQTYIACRASINNWDLVDVTTLHIVGAHLFKADCSLLYAWAKSKNLWERRMAVLATFYFIGRNDFSHALKIAKILLQDPQDLIHKAVGWQLREIGKRDLKVEENFLKKHAHEMPRTMLRYAIEKFPEKKRLSYLYKKGNKKRPRIARPF